MAIYVQSRGKNQDQDYRWLRIKSNEYYPENPEFLLQSIEDLPVRPIDLIESQKPSIILSAKQNDYYLLLTGLKSRKERNDFTGRPIRNSVLWIEKKDSENLMIRSLLILALRDEIAEYIDQNINFSGEYGFQAKYHQLRKFSKSPLALENNHKIDFNYKIGKNCESLKRKIALELENNTLPDKEGLLILVTSLKSTSSLKETKVWRGLSNRVEFEELRRYSAAATQPDTEKKPLWIWVAIASILLIAIALIIIQLTTPQQPHQIDPSSPNLNKSTQLEKKSGDFSKKELTSTELLSACQNQREIDYFLSPCSSNVKNN